MADTDFNIQQLAAYLHLHAAQVTRLAERGKLPGRKVGGQWRFSQGEIHHWMEKRMGLLDDDALAHVEGALERADTATDEEPLSMVALLTEEAIAIPLQARTRGKVITVMTELTAQAGRLWDAGKMAKAVRAREEMQSTALDNGVALLHPRRPLPAILPEAVLALGCTHGGIPFGGQSGALTDVFFLIGSKTDRGHLRTLARLIRIISDATVLRDLRAACDPATAYQIMTQKDIELN